MLTVTICVVLLIIGFKTVHRDTPLWQAMVNGLFWGITIAFVYNLVV
jgi:hypothetical protein